jgi:alpha-amylase
MIDLNGVMMQYFHWYLPPDGSLWQHLATNAEELVQRGVTSVWLPPAYKGMGGGYDVGYGVYDMFDLGEFDQKGSVRTKYGTKDEYIQAITALRSRGVRVYADAVFNHRMGADAEEEAEALPIDPDNRTRPVGDWQKVKVWTHFTFPGRGTTYSSLQWHWWHFTAIDFSAYHQGKRAIYLLRGKDFERNVDPERGNYDYLMGCDLDVWHPEVSGELKYWGEWILDTTGVDGFRFDAVKHVDAKFFQEWLMHLRNYTKREVYAVGEYWSYDVEILHRFIHETEGKIDLFDAPLHLNFYKASKAGNQYDLRTIFDNTLVKMLPTFTVTLVENHDTQPLQALESVVEAWFKPHAYALILLRREGYPCIFHADYYGATYRDKGRDGNQYEITMASHKAIIDSLLDARQNHAFGDQIDYFDHPNTIGWTRLGDQQHPGGLAVVLGNGDRGVKWMHTAAPECAYVDITGHVADVVTTNSAGWAEFSCNPSSVSVWVPRSSVS